MRARAILWPSVAAFSVGFAALSIGRQRAFNTGRFDLGNMTQAVWATAHGLTPVIGTVTMLRVRCGSVCTSNASFRFSAS